MTLIALRTIPPDAMQTSVVGDQAFVDEAVRPGVAEAEHLRIDQVRPLGTKDDGPHLLQPVCG